MASVPVLLYHHVAPDREVTPAGFERQLDWLAANGYRTLSADELAAHMSGAYPAPKRSVGLTFDDGYADNWIYAYPALKRRKMKAHLFVVTSRVTEAARRAHAGEGGVLADTRTAERAPEGFASWSELSEMSKEGVFEIGSHTHSHRDWVKNSTYVDLPGELDASKRLIEERLKTWHGTFAWPWGDFKPEWLSLLKPRGYRLAFTTVVGPNTPGTSALKVERFKVQNDDVSWLAKRLWLYGRPALAKTYQRLYGLDRKFWQAVGLKMKDAFKKLLPYLKPHWVRFAQAGAAMVIVAATQAGVVYLVKPIIDQIFITKNEHTLIGVVLALPLLFVVRGFATYAMNYLMGSASQKAAQKLREDLFRHLTRLSVEFFWRQRTGEILSRVTNDLNAVQDTMQYVPLFAVRDTLTVIGLIGILFYLNWKFALMSFFMAPVIGIFLDKIGRKMRNAARQSQAHMADLYHLFAEALHGMTVIKAFHYEEGANRKFREENARYFGQMMRYLRAMSLSAPVLEFLGSLGGVAFLYFGARQVFAGQMSAGDFFTFMGALFAAYMPLKNLATAYAKVQIGVASTERLFHILDEKPNVVEPERPVPFRHLNDGIELRAVGYMYPSRELWAMRGVSLKVRKGEAVAVVGQSGSGKSTLIGLLLRLFDPVEGAVLFDGVDLRELALGQLRDQMGLVTQETTLFNDTVAGNVALGRDATLAEIEEACRAAAAEDFILGLPKGYDTPLGDRGVQLSGGQRQRLAIARALLSNPSILLLDEATSNLDSRSERQIQDALANLQRGRTVLTVAHRLSTVQNADRIIVMNEGRVVEEGTHKGLLAAGGAYQRLYELQTTTPEE